jgi:mono/diheme cytochrome c family protein
MTITAARRWVRAGSAPVIGAVLLGAAVGLATTRPTPAAAGAAQAPDGKQLYPTHCLQCHGEQGDGQVPAARFLYPKPRNFTEVKFRLVTTPKLVPTDDDLFQAITRGMPGSAMVPFGHLSEADRKALVGYVKELTRAGFMAGVRREAEAAGEKPDPAELIAQVDEALAPGETVAVPADLPAADAASVARGKAVYAKGCAACHGETGKGDGAQNQQDSDGTPTVPRDFTRGIFKGGREVHQLYARIALGMPGTPMPANTFEPGEIGDLINYVRSLSDPAAQARVEHRRQAITAKRVAGPLPAEVPAAVWASAPAVPVVVSPLWWRNYAEPDLTVAAVHDGRTLAVRLSWQDASCNDRIASVDDFEDMAAVQLFAGPAEPFLGMGAEGAAPDIWLWRASWQRPADESYSQLDDYPFDNPLYRDQLKGPARDFRTARAAGNLHARPDAAQTASSLAAKGFGTTTFRPKAAQQVTARAAWAGGRWAVELRRPLAVGADGGVALAPGGRCSVAFAVWDGAARDRNGQKLVSIWHDLRVE